MWQRVTLGLSEPRTTSAYLVDEKDLDTPTPYLLGNYRRPGGGDLLIALARPTRMGADSTAPVVSSLVERLKPTCLAMCGVCAGNPADIALGDVMWQRWHTPTTKASGRPTVFRVTIAPAAMAAQNLTLSCRQATVGRPGDGICPRYN